MTPLVSVVIPTWQGADVIEDAIACTQAQTVDDLEIIVAVDKCEDATAELARAAAADDSRIRVIESTHRLGWVRNVNAALERVRGEQFFLYFHDDLIQADYLRSLTALLDENPAAMSAFCTVEQDSGEQLVVDRGRSYGGGPLQRMLDRLLLPHAGAPLRALTRRRVLDRGLRFPEGSQHGFHAQHAYLLDLIGRADSVYLDRPLYRRRNWRPGALTKGWRKAPVTTLASDLKIVAQTMTRTAQSLLANAGDRALVHAAIELRLLPILRGVECDQQTSSLTAAPLLFAGSGQGTDFPERWASHAHALASRISDLEQYWRSRREMAG
jgi:glycosyltransferase involved in cell wall biosynthesis